MQTNYKPLDLSARDADGNAVPSVVNLRYRPLPALSCADYAEKHLGLLESSGAFETLMYSAAQLQIGKGVIDLAGLAALGKAFSTVLTKSVGDAKRLRMLIREHCKDFDVEVEHNGAWVKLDSDDAINAHLTDLDQCIMIVYALGGGVLRPLWNRLRSSVEEKRSESEKPSTETSLES